MEIIERGTLPEERSYTARCVHCKTKVRFFDYEVERRWSDPRNESYVEVTCPVCRKKIVHCV